MMATSTYTDIADPAHGAAEANQFFLGRGRARNQFAINAAMRYNPRGRESECAGYDTSATMRAGGWKSVNILGQYLEMAEYNVWK